MTAKTLEKVPVTLGGFVHPLAESIYSVDELATSLPASVTIYNGDLGGHYEQINAGGKNDARVSITCSLFIYRSRLRESHVGSLFFDNIESVRLL